MFYPALVILLVFFYSSDTFKSKGHCDHWFEEKYDNNNKAEPNLQERSWRHVQVKLAREIVCEKD